MHNLSKEDLEKSERNEVLKKQLDEVEDEYLRVDQDYHAGKASEVELIKVKDKLNKIQ